MEPQCERWIRNAGDGENDVGHVAGWAGAVAMPLASPPEQHIDVACGAGPPWTAQESSRKPALSRPFVAAWLGAGGPRLRPTTTLVLSLVSDGYGNDGFARRQKFVRPLAAERYHTAAPRIY